MNPNSVTNVARIGIFLFILIIASSLAFYLSKFFLIIVGIISAVIINFSIQIVPQWEQVVVLRFGKYKRMLKPGLTFLIPFIDTIAERVDQRIRATSFMAEQTLTMDTVPVDVDAVLFWLVYDVRKAILEVSDYQKAVLWAAQTTLREVIGSSMLSDLLSNRRKLDMELLEAIDKKTEPWGITVQSVELRDIIIPQILQDAMSREAQAERERRARVLLSQAEVDVAKQIVMAASHYEENPTALKLRSLNILSEGVKNKGSVIVIPSDMSYDAKMVGAALANKKIKAQDLTNQGEEKTII
ncbi:MAG: slipin family protein [Bacillota bacterium]|nr:slipin family protein [Bacillota bacterium]